MPDNLFIYRASFKHGGSATWTDEARYEAPGSDELNQYATEYIARQWGHTLDEVVDVWCVPANGYPYR